MIATLAVALIPGLGHLQQKGEDWILGRRRACFIRILKVGRAHQAIRFDCWLAGEAMEHQHPLAQTIRSYFKCGSVTRERVVASIPGATVRWRGRVEIVLTIIKDQLEVPVWACVQLLKGR